MRPALTLAAALLLALPLARPAAAEVAMSLGIYLWTNTEEPVKAQFISIAEGNAEIEIDTPDGSQTGSHAVTPAETQRLKSVVEGRMKALTLADAPQPKPPFITVEWSFSTDSSSAQGSATYQRDALPDDVLALQKATFGDTYSQ